MAWWHFVQLTFGSGKGDRCLVPCTPIVKRVPSMPPAVACFYSSPPTRNSVSRWWSPRMPGKEASTGSDSGAKALQGQVQKHDKRQVCTV
jgi:hypothetical protein